MRAVTARFRRGAQRVRALVVAALFLTGGVACSEDAEPVGPRMRGGDFYPAWSADGKTVAYLKEDIDSLTGDPIDHLSMVDVATGRVTTLTDLRVPPMYDLSWSPDGRWLTFSTFARIGKVFATGDSMQLLVSGEFHSSSTWSLLHDEILFVVNGHPEGGVFSIKPDGSELRRRSPHELTIGTVARFPDSDSLAVSQGSAGNCVGVYAPGDTVLSLPLRCGLSWASTVRVLRNPRYLAYYGRLRGGEELAMYLFDRAMGTNRKLCDGVHFDAAPDRDALVFSDVWHTRGLKIIDVLTGKITQLTPERP